jgi:dopamine beta-monooxygenase
LGDPDCTWVEGEQPSSPAIGHPGIFNNSTVATDDGDDPLFLSTCAHYVPPPDVQLLDVTFRRANVLDGRRTQYICEQFTVPSPQAGLEDYHQIKMEPLLDNDEVLHHMIIYSCEGDGVTSSDGDRVDQGPYDCDGMEANCVAITGWALGEEEYCEPQNVGSEIWFGRSGTNAIFKIEAHYDNALETPGITDQSGIRLHLTSTLRPLSSSDLTLGMTYWDRQFQLPAQQSAVTKTNICPAKATSTLKHPIYVYSWYPHMHLYGSSMVTEHYRCGVKLGELGRITQYEFDNQQSYSLPRPVKVLPGDSLVTTCTFNTQDADAVIWGGESTTEEMCDNDLTFYPSTWTEDDPDFFTSCNSFQEGFRPEFADDDDGYDDDGFDTTTPFVSLDPNGDLAMVGSYESDPTKDLAPCCNGIVGNGAACEALYLAPGGKPCGVDGDCQGDIPCIGGLCGGYSSSARGTPPRSVPYVLLLPLVFLWNSLLA